MNAGLAWAFIGGGLAATYLVVFAFGRAAAAGERRLVHLDDAPATGTPIHDQLAAEFGDDLMAIADAVQDSDPRLHAAMDHVMAAYDLALWDLEFSPESSS